MSVGRRANVPRMVRCRRVLHCQGLRVFPLLSWRLTHFLDIGFVSFLVVRFIASPVTVALTGRRRPWRSVPHRWLVFTLSSPVLLKRLQYYQSWSPASTIMVIHIPPSKALGGWVVVRRKLKNFASRHKKRYGAGGKHTIHNPQPDHDHFFLRRGLPPNSKKSQY